MKPKRNQKNTGLAETSTAPPAHSRPTFRKAFAKFWKDESGEHAIEFLMILTFGVFPLIATVYLLEDMLKEYVAFAQIFVSSPFF